jgi:cytochrome oxidase assembly protein ShyY1
VLHVLLTRRWLVRVVAGLALVAACVLLGLWQLDRLDQRSARNAVIEANADRAPAPIDEVVTPGVSVTAQTEWTPVIVTGEYDSDSTLLLRLRPVDGERGVHVVTPLVTASGTAVLVDRGFLPGVDDATAEVPDPPAGTTTVTGRLRPSETGRGVGGDLTASTIRYIDVEEIAAGISRPLYSGWLAVLDEDAAAPAGLTPLPEPEVESGPHLSYAIQWFLFATIGVGGFVLLIRAEAAASAPARAAEPTQLQRHGLE